MCQSYGHSDSTLDLIINQTVQLTAKLSVRCRVQKKAKQTSSDLMQTVCTVCAEMDLQQSCLDGADDCA